MKKRHISAIQIPQFPVAVERVVDSSLKGKPVIVAPLNSPRSLIISSSSEAHSEGIFDGMPLQQAVSLCPSCTLLSPNRRLYRRALKALSKVYYSFTPVMEPFMLGNYYLDLSGTDRLFGSTLDTAAKIQKQIHDDLRLNISVGVAVNKLTSKIAASVIQPLKIHEVPYGNESEFISPYKTDMLPSVDKLVIDAFREVNLITIGQIALTSEQHISMLIGKQGYIVYKQSKGIDPSPVRMPELQPLLRQEKVFGEDTNDIGMLFSALNKISSRIGRTLRKRKMTTRELRLLVVYSDEHEDKGISRLRHPLFLDEDLFSASKELLKRVLKRRVRVRVLELTASRLAGASRQAELFAGVGNLKEKKDLNEALDTIRRKFGENSIALAGYS